MRTKEKFYQFNLLPPKSLEEIKQVEERDTPTVYAFVLIFMSVLAFFVLNLMQLMLIEPAKVSVDEDLSALKAQRVRFTGVQEKFGELYIKAGLLSIVLEQDIKVIGIIEQSKLIAGTIAIQSYERDESGIISISMESTSLKEIYDLVAKAKENKGIEDLQIHSIKKDTTKYKFQLTFKIVA